MGSCSIEMVADQQLCYVPCNFCNIVLAVSVPCSNLMDIVTVRCGHCTNLWSVNMAAAFQYSLSAASRAQQQQQPADHLSLHHHQKGGNYNVYQAGGNTNDQQYYNGGGGGGSSSSSSSSSSSAKSIPTTKLTARASPPQNRIVNRPPEKRQRVPSAYNQFIKEEIQRIKANNPDITHREAFSTAAKNWAHFPHIHFGLMLESNKKTTY